MNEENMGSVLLKSRRGSFAPVVSPEKSQNERISKTKRRWALLRNVARVVHRPNSLTEAEQDFLNSLQTSTKQNNSSVTSSSNDSTSTIIGEDTDKDEISSLATTTQQHTREHHTRRQLRQSLVSSKNTLTPAEASFLNHIANSSNVSPEVLESCHRVLSADPLYRSSNIELHVAPPTRNGIRPRPPSTTSSNAKDNGASFRKETWTHYNTATAANTSKEMLEPLAEEEQQQEEEEETIEAVWVEKAPGMDHPLTKLLVNFYDEQDKDQGGEAVSEEESTEPLPFSILATSANDEACQPHVLSPPMMDALRPHLPFAVQFDNFWLKYSMIRDGASMRSLLQHVRSSARTILAIETMEGEVFGAFTSSPWRPHGHDYYGSGEAFVWRLAQSRATTCATVQDQIWLERQIQVFPWSGENRNVQSLVNADDSPLILGGGGAEPKTSINNDDNNNNEGLALAIDATLSKGTSDKCLTFHSPALVKSTDVFDIANIEVWTLTPVENVNQAEQLELSRQFVFDHGNFLEQ
mmetsp:Transcript_3770/g.6832  ORF Transcript_3770/g.6832 Transcript_3770/m.6832 type:complete len:524 (-) Transcript_3770:108-1679(-)